MENDESEDYQAFTPTRAGKPWLKIAIIASTTLVVLGGAAGAYYFITHRRPAPKQAGTTISQQQANPDQSTEASPQAYTSNGKDLNLKFTYPSTWAVTPDSNNNTGDTPIVVTSPLVTLAGANGRSATGKVVLQIRPISTSLTEFAPGKATTSQDSVQIGYDKPTPSQHQYPYITFVDLNGANATVAFNEVLITGISSYPKNTPISTDSLEIDPVISATFYQCATQACTGSGLTLLDITPNTWQSDTTAKQALSIFQSLQLE